MKISPQGAATTALIATLWIAAFIAWRANDPKADDEECAFALMGDMTSPRRYSVYSRSEDGVRRDNGGAPGRGWMAAEPWQPYRNTDAASFRAFNDRTYYHCRREDSDPAAFLWFSEFRSAPFTRLLAKHRAQSAEGDAVPPVFVAVGVPEDWNSGERVLESRRFLEQMQRAYKATIPSWWPSEDHREITILGWFDRGILLAGSLPDQFFYVKIPGGFTGPMDAKGNCQFGTAGVLCKQTPSQYLGTSSGTATGREAVDQTRRRISSVLRGKHNRQTRRELVAFARDTIEQMAGRGEACNALVATFLQTNEAWDASLQQDAPDYEVFLDRTDASPYVDPLNDIIDRAQAVLEASACGPL